MAKIDNYVHDILSAVFGEEVRGSIAAALTAVSEESGQALVDAETSMTASLASQEASEASAESAAQANQSARSAELFAQQAGDDADTSVEAANRAISTSNQAKETADAAIEKATKALETSNTAITESGEAKTAASTAETAAINAQTSAANAEASALASQNSASNAQASASAAEASAQAAEEFAQQAADANQSLTLATEAKALATANKERLDTVEEKTQENKAKLDTIENGAQVNKIEAINVNGTPAIIADKVASVTIPLKFSDMTDDVGYLKENDLLSELQTLNVIRFSYVSVLPETGEEGILYLVPETTGKEGNLFAEFVWKDSAYELLGAAKMDLSGYWKHDDLQFQSIENGFTVTWLSNTATVTTPVKGVDYFTLEDKQEMLSYVIQNIPVAETGAF